MHAFHKVPAADRFLVKNIMIDRYIGLNLFLQDIGFNLRKRTMYRWPRYIEMLISRSIAYYICFALDIFRHLFDQIFLSTARSRCSPIRNGTDPSILQGAGVTNTNTYENRYYRSQNSSIISTMARQLLYNRYKSEEL